jgi:hypothetical protein
MMQGRENRKVDRGKMACNLENIFETSLNTLLEDTEKAEISGKT